MGQIINATSAYVEDNNNNKVSIIQQKKLPYNNIYTNVMQSGPGNAKNKLIYQMGCNSNSVYINTTTGGPQYYYTYKSVYTVLFDQLKSSPLNAVFSSPYTTAWGSTYSIPFANVVWCNTDYVDNGDATAFTSLSNLLNGNHNQYIINYQGMYLYNEIWIDSSGYVNAMSSQFTNVKPSNITSDAPLIATAQGLVQQFPQSIQSNYTQYSNYSNILYSWNSPTLNAEVEPNLCFAIV